MTETFDRFPQLSPTESATTGHRKSKPKAEELLIEEILKAAGLESLD